MGVVATSDYAVNHVSSKLSLTMYWMMFKFSCHNKSEYTQDDFSVHFNDSDIYFNKTQARKFDNKSIMCCRVQIRSCTGLKT